MRTASAPSLKSLLKRREFPTLSAKKAEKELSGLQHQMLRSQLGIWHEKSRAILVFEGMDAAGKGGAIRRLTEGLDPRGFQVHPIGPPTSDEQGRHYLYRFWRDLPLPGTIAIFDRSWYGRVLVERVEGLIPKARWEEAYAEIVSFEKLLWQDGITLVKFFLAIDPKEQLRRFEARLADPDKQWKLTLDDIQARRHWDDYVDAAETMLKKTHTAHAPWHLIAANDKEFARQEVLKVATKELQQFANRMEKKVEKHHRETLKQALERLGEKEL